MSLEQIKEKIKGAGDFINFNKKFRFWLIIINLLMICYILIQISIIQGLSADQAGITVLENAFESAINSSNLGKGSITDAKFLASVSGKRYYPVGCKSANRIKVENRIYFKSQEEAEKGGYTPALNC